MELYLSSVAIPGRTWRELECQGIYHIDLENMSQIEVTPWNVISPEFYGNFAILNKKIPNHIDLELSEESVLHSLFEFERVLNEAIRLRTTDLPKGFTVGILYSGGIDSTTIALLTDRHIPKEESIDLINVAFATMTSDVHEKDTFNVPDRLTAKESLKELR